MLLDNVTPATIKKMSMQEKYQLCDEIRNFLIEKVTVTGGHLASNLGTVELTVAFHAVFDTPDDKIVFDVGHQSYTHKILTGRKDQFDKLRCKNGISGFERPSESPHDAFISGHAGISISSALGLAYGMALKRDEHHVVAVLGDGAITSGEAYEGLNNAGKLGTRLIIVLNDNEMSISKSSGAVANYLTQIRSTQKYYETKNKVKEVLNKSEIGKVLTKSVKDTKNLVKYAIYQSNIFENLGFKYLGPVNGHSIEELIEILTVAKSFNAPCIVHIKTKKGKGYRPAEENSGAYHGICKSSAKNRIGLTYSEAVGEAIKAFGELDSKICAITAAMKYATGLQVFAKSFPERFFDVGIAEAHAATFAGGLAASGMIPVFAVYSTFLQRSYDQLIHDISIEKLHVVLCIDRAGVVGEDGETHQGVFDVAMLSSIPHVSIYSPTSIPEINYSLKQALYVEESLAAVRYPRGLIWDDDENLCTENYKLLEENGNATTLVVTYGRIYLNAKRLLSSEVSVLKLVKIFPIMQKIVEIAFKFPNIFFFEEGMLQGGVAERLLYLLTEKGYKGNFCITAIDDEFVKVDDVEGQLEENGLDYASMKKKVNSAVKRLDIRVTELSISKSRTEAQQLIGGNSITVNGKVCAKSSQIVSDDDKIQLKGELPRYVGRGGLKIEKAIEYFNIDLTGKICMDIGASTGGFTDCMLQNGAQKVYAIDVGTAQLAEKLRNDARVISFEKLDIRNANGKICEKVDFASVDVSFISLTLIIPEIVKYLKLQGEAVLLIKPQFETGKKNVTKNGIIRDKKVQEATVKKITEFAKSVGFIVIGVTDSPIHGGDGNAEFLMYLKMGENL